MKQTLQKIITLILVIGLNHTGVLFVGETYAFYSDEEKSFGNSFRAGVIDIEVKTTEFYATSTATSLSPGDIVEKEIVVFPDKSNSFKYTASTTNMMGDLDFCNALKSKISLEGTEIYNNDLSGFLSEATTTLDSWNLKVGMGMENLQNKICNFDIDFLGSQTRNNLELGKGYSDKESVSHTVASWGFRINKVYYDVGRRMEETPQPNHCPALSQGYWGNHEGCFGGTGSSNWETEINTLSTTFSGAFATSSGAYMCEVLHTPSCPSGETFDAKLCRAKNKVLADELNVVSGRLDLNAIISGADDGDISFDNLGLDSLSTVQESLIALEQVLVNNNATLDDLVGAGYVAERIYSFYENENPDSPYCIYEEDLTAIITEEVEGDNEWVEIYNQTNVPLDISGWEICDNESCDLLSAAELIPPMGYGLIVASSTTASNTIPAFWYLPDDVVEIILPDTKIGNGLHNERDMLVLKRPDGIVMDQVNWGIPNNSWFNYNEDLWDPGAIDVVEGNVLSRLPNGYDTNQASDFFELAPPSVDLIYPDENASYKWYWGDVHTIEWTAINNNGDDSELLIDINYIKDINRDQKINEGDEMISIVKNTINDGEFIWAVPSGFDGDIWIYLVATGLENSMLNIGTVSGNIHDPPPLLSISEEPLTGIATTTSAINEEVGTTEVVEEVSVSMISNIVEEIVSIIPESLEIIPEEIIVIPEISTTTPSLENPITEPVLELLLEEPVGDARTPSPVEEVVLSPEETLPVEEIPLFTEEVPVVDDPSLMAEEETIAEPTAEPIPESMSEPVTEPVVDTPVELPVIDPPAKIEEPVVDIIETNQIETI